MDYCNCGALLVSLEQRCPLCGWNPSTDRTTKRPQLLNTEQMHPPPANREMFPRWNADNTKPTPKELPETNAVKTIKPKSQPSSTAETRGEKGKPSSKKVKGKKSLQEVIVVRAINSDQLGSLSTPSNPKRFRRALIVARTEGSTGETPLKGIKHAKKYHYELITDLNGSLITLARSTAFWLDGLQTPTQESIRRFKALQSYSRSIGLRCEPWTSISRR